MVNELHMYSEQMKTMSPKDWDEDDRRKVKYALRCVLSMIITEARVVISTNNNLAGGLVHKDFGSNARTIILIRDEDPKELEASGWVPITKMEHSDKISRMILVGDPKQLQQTVISHTVGKKVNDFSPQLLLSLMSRLMMNKAEVKSLVRQYRMRPALSAFPSQRVYDGKMINSESRIPVTVSLQNFYASSRT